MASEKTRQWQIWQRQSRGSSYKQHRKYNGPEQRTCREPWPKSHRFPMRGVEVGMVKAFSTWTLECWPWSVGVVQAGVTDGCSSPVSNSPG
jgi:hypothetical protein